MKIRRVKIRTVKRTWCLFLSLLLATGSSSCSQPDKHASEAQPEPAAAPSARASWVSARRAVGTSLLDAPARVLISPDASAAISVPMQARVLRVRVQPGQTVAAGAAVAEVLMPELLRAAGDFSAEQLRAEALLRRKTQLEALKNEGLARVTELAEVDAALASARAGVQSARATLKSAGVSDAQAAALLTGDGSFVLRSPIAGVVINVDATTGEVREPSGKALAWVAGGGDGRIEARLPSPPDAAVQFVYVDAGTAVPLKRIAVSPRAESSDGTTLVWFALADATPLVAGTFGRVRMVADPKWTVIPARALVQDNATQDVQAESAPARLPPRGTSGRAEVWVRQGKTLQRQPVQVVLRGGAEVVVSGLAVGTMVSADAATLMDGAAHTEAEAPSSVGAP